MHSPISRRALAIGGALCALTFAVAACGSDNNNSTSSSGGGASTTSGSKAQKVGRPAAGHQVVRPLGVVRPAAAAGGLQVRRRAGDDRERPGRQVDPAAAGRAADHERGEGAPAREPRLRLGRGHRGQRRVARREGHRLRPPDPQGPGRVLRVLRQRQGGRAAGPGPRQVPRLRRQARDRRAQRLADRQQRHAVQAGLRLGPQAAVLRVARPRRSPISPCPTGTTRRR